MFTMFSSTLLYVPSRGLCLETAVRVFRHFEELYFDKENALSRKESSVCRCYIFENNNLDTSKFYRSHDISMHFDVCN